jgi:mannan endo-1,4-beta-mannosidase
MFIRSWSRFLRSASLGAVLGCATLLCTAQAQIHRFEAETGQLFGVQVANSVPGYSGTGYVTGFNSSTGSDYFQLQANIPAGLYEMWVGYRSQYGQKGYDYRVNNEYGSGMFDQSTVFTTDRTGLFSIPAGTSTLGIYQSWGYYDVDYLEFRPYTPPTLLPVAPHLVDAQADYHTRVLMNYLAGQYGQKTLSGQHHQQSENLAFPVASYLSKSGGIIPAIRSSDFIEYSPSRLAYGSTPDNETEQAIAWAKQTGGVVSMMWHWNAPANLINQPEKEWWRGFYSDATTFNLPGALANPGGSDYQLLLRDIDAIAIELQKFADAGVPVIWHPLHEAQGGWFWWGDHGPETFKSLWNLMYDRLTDHHGLHNLIWEYTIATSAAEGFDPDWYPGDDQVDMVGLDIYTDASSSMSGEWIEALNLFNGNKMIALSESGTVPDPTTMDLWGIEWSYFSPWKGTYVDDMDPVQLQATLNHEDIVILNELPVLPWKNQGIFLSADFNFDGAVDLGDLGTWQAAYGGSSAGDADGDRDTDGADLLIWQRQITAANTLLTTPIQVPEAGTLALGALLSLFVTRFLGQAVQKAR